MSIFSEISIVLLIAAVVSFIMKFIKQPLVVGYILTGIIVGPSFLNVLQNHEVMELFSKFGITILLFIVGLHLSPQVIKEVGKVSLITGLSQVIFTSVVGFLLAIALGIDRTAAIYVSIALTFSSTIIILKLLSDKGDIQSLYGKIAIGFLLVQDIIASIILITVSSVATTSSTEIPTVIMALVLKGIGIFVGLYIVSKWILPKLIEFSASSSELLFLFSLTWGFGFAVLFQVLGFSVEIGALIAGVVLSSSDYAEEMSSRLRSLRDFFIILFFILLGANMVLTLDSAIIVPALIFSLYVLVGNPTIMIIIMNLLGYHKKTGFMAGLTVAQISEFSLILASLGLQVGHLSREVLTIVTLVGLITISASTYLILYSERIYPFVIKLLTFLELRKSTKTGVDKRKTMDVFIFGFNRVGKNFTEHFNKQGYSIGIIDFDPNTKDKISSKKTRFFYGDAGNVEFLSELDFRSTKVVVSTIPELETNMLLGKYVHAKNAKAIVIIFCQTSGEALKLYAAGVDYVVMPHYLGAKHTTDILEKVGFNQKKFNQKRSRHITELENLSYA